MAVDTLPSRLEMACRQGAEAIDFNAEDPVSSIRELTLGAGADCVIDAVGVDAEPASAGPSAATSDKLARYEHERAEVAPRTHSPDGLRWRPGGAPSQALEWSINAVAKGGVVSLIGVYPPSQTGFPIGLAMQRNLTLRMGNCNHRHYVPGLVSRVKNGTLDPRAVVPQTEPLPDVIAAYEAFDTRQAGWVKVSFVPSG